MGTTILFIDESIHVIHRLGAAGLGAGSCLAVLQNVLHGPYQAQRHPTLPTKAMFAT